MPAAPKYVCSNSTKNKLGLAAYAQWRKNLGSEKRQMYSSGDGIHHREKGTISLVSFKTIMAPPPKQNGNTFGIYYFSSPLYFHVCP